MTISAFRGLNNVSDPLRLDMSWLVQADNVNISDTGALSKRGGFTLSRAGSISSIYATLDYQRGYLVDGGVLKSFAGASLKTGLTSAPMYWAEVNDQVFYNNGTDSGVILPDNTVLAWAWPVPTTPTLAAVTGSLASGLYQVRFTYTLPDGRETGSGDPAEIYLTAGQALQVSGIPLISGGLTNAYIAPANSTIFQRAFTSAGATAFVWNSQPSALGIELAYTFLDPLPAGTDVIQHWKGRMYAAQYFPAEDATAVWFTKALGFHLFNYNSGFFLLPGKVLMLAPHDDALIVGTDKKVYSYTPEKLTELAPYGVAPGQHWDNDDGRLLFWTLRGLCAALPFTNLTERQVSVAPGVLAGGAIVRDGGQKRYVVAIQQGGSAFNSFT
jgi:hypothetical protein